MKKSVLLGLGLIAIIPLYCGATWINANIARQRIDQAITRITDQAHGAITIASRTSVNHFFTASEDIVFEINYPVLNLWLKANGTDKPANRFTIHNDIAYGPIPGFRSLGVARIETSLVLTDDQRKKLIEVIGTDKPLEFFTTFGYFGNSYFDIVSRKFDVHFKDSPETGTWKGGKLRFSLSGDAKDVSFKGNMPGLIVNGKNNSVLHIDDITFKGALQRKFDVLFVGNESFGIGNISFSEPGNPDSSVSIKDVLYGANIGADDKFLNFTATLGSGSFTARSMALKETHVDFGMSHLDVPSLVSLNKTLEEWRMDQFKQSSGTDNTTDNTNAANTANTAAVQDKKEKLKQAAISLLQHDPVFTLDNVGFATQNGVLKITGTVDINGVVAEDFSPDMNFDALRKKIHAQVDIGIDQPLIDHWPITTSAAQIKQQISALESQGFVALKGTKVESHIEYKDGKLTANGKPVGG